MSSPIRRGTAVLLAAGIAGGIGALSQVPYEAEPADHAVIRLAWRVRGTRVEECRRLTDEELQRLPQHMRREEECEGRMLPYRLQVVLDGLPVVDDVVRASGAREDRPIYVYRELPVSPGDHEIRVHFELQRREVSTPRVAEDVSVPESASALLLLTADLSLGPKEVALVTYDAERRQLVARGYGTR